MYDPNKISGGEEEKEIKKPEAITFKQETLTLLLGLKDADVEHEKIQSQAEQNGFERKKEFHATAIGYPNGKKIRSVLEKMKKNEREEKIKQILDLGEKTNWQYTLSPEIIHVKKEYPFKTHSETRESYIRLIDMPGLITFYEELNKILGTTFAVPPAHITLYSKSTNSETNGAGVGLNSDRELEMHMVNKFQIEK